jgi:hypothetical protein
MVRQWMAETYQEPPEFMVNHLIVRDQAHYPGVIGEKPRRFPDAGFYLPSTF